MQNLAFLAEATGQKPVFEKPAGGRSSSIYTTIACQRCSGRVKQNRTRKGERR
jgi:hypothetical protein